MNQGDRREPIVIDDQDRQLFWEALGASGANTGWQIQAWGLMGNLIFIWGSKRRGRI
jgi:hypothetical protein